MAPSRLISCALAAALFPSAALDNGVARTPPRGYTTWENFNFAVSDDKLRAVADDMVSLHLLSAGYDILWLDDGWPTCSAWEGAHGISKCKTPAPRDAEGRIVPDIEKFPSGIASTFAYIHAKGLRVGIYTAPHAQTCGGYAGSLHHEAIDAATFAAWGVDAVKMDAGCQEDCSIHDGCLLGSLERMRDALNATGRSVVYYVDDGNPTTGPKVYNPLSRGFPVNNFTRSHIARTWSENVVHWGPDVANMYKLWFDRSDSWQSLLDNAHQQQGLSWFQAPGQFLAPDQLTIGQGRFTLGESRAEIFLYAALAAPMFLSCELAALRAAPELLDLVTNPELLAINADEDGVMATLLTPAPGALWDAPVDERWAADVWARPLSDSSFVFVLVNRDPLRTRNITILFGDGGDGSDADLFPVSINRARIRDVAARVDIGEFDLTWSALVPPHDARIVRVTRVA